MRRCLRTLVCIALVLASPLNLLADLGFIANGNGGNVTVFDTTTDTVIRSINVGSMPRGIISFPNARKVVVVNELSETFSLIDTERLVVVATIALPAGSAPHGIIRSQDETRAFVAGKSGAQAAVFVVDMATFTIINTLVIGGSTTYGFDLALMPAGVTVPAPTLYVTVPGDNMIGIVNLVTGASTTLTGITSPRQLALHPTMPKLYVTKLDGVNSLGVLDLTSNTFSFLPFGSVFNTLDVVVLPGGSKGYVTTTGGIFKFNPMTDTPTGSFGGFSYPQNDLTLAPMENKLYVGSISTSSPAISYVNTTSDTIAATLASGGNGPRRVVVAPPNPPPGMGRLCPMAVRSLSNETATVYGFNFIPGAVVRIGAIDSPSVTFISSTELRYVTPPLQSGSYTVTVINPDLRSDMFPAVLTSAGDVTRSLALPAGSEVWQYRMVSFPCFVRGSDFKQAMLSALGPYDPAVWRAFRWESNQNRYSEFQEAQFEKDCDMVGVSFWILSRKDGIITIPGLNTADASAEIYIDLDPGWNQIATPAGPVDWSTVLVGTKKATAVPVGSTTNTYVTQNLFAFQDGVYYATTAMLPRQGYWVKNLTGAKLYLFMSATTLAKPAPAPLLTPLSKSDEQPPPPPGFSEPSAGGGGGGGGGGGCYISTVAGQAVKNHFAIPIALGFTAWVLILLIVRTPRKPQPHA